MQRPWQLAMLLVAAPVSLGAQAWTSRATGAKDGEVRIAFAARDGICGDGRSFIRDRRRGDNVMMGNFDGSSSGWRSRPCEEGPVRVALKVRAGAVRSARVYVGGDWPAGSAETTDLGHLGVKEATTGLLALARTSETRSGGDLIFPATIADSVEIWPALLSLARDRSAPQETRKQAVFWVSQAAGDKAAEGLSGLVSDDGEDREVREQAVFALSQLPKDQGVPILMRVAKTNRDREIRRKAMFWLGQSDDPRALALFEEILTKPNR